MQKNPTSHFMYGFVTAYATLHLSGAAKSPQWMGEWAAPFYVLMLCFGIGMHFYHKAKEKR